jgi:hypothetical protein
MPTTNAETQTPPPIIVPIGGFLGAGKTSLILAASRVLKQNGIKPAAVLNDQGRDLVDTRYVQENGVPADEVTGGCFCCRFSDLIEASVRLRAYSPDVIFAEAVGSCTDISATTLQPLKFYYSGDFQLAPYTVLVDPARAKELANASPNDDLAFLFQKQIDEADLVCFTRSDLYQEFPDLAESSTRCLSTLTGEGVAAWLDEVLSGKLQPGARILNIDYERYARAEARLAWLNCKTKVILQAPLSPSVLVGPFLEDLDAALTAEGLQIAHLKITDESPSGFLKASITRNGGEPMVQGMLDASPGDAHHLLLNVRASGEPSALQRIVAAQVSRLPGKVELYAMQCFSPAPPKPEFRLNSVVERLEHNGPAKVY